MGTVETKKEPTKQEILDTLVDSKDLGFSVRVKNGALALKIKTLGELAEAFKKQDSNFRSIFGKKSRTEIYKKIIGKGLGHLSVVR